MDYQTQFELNIKKVNDIFKKTFSNLDICEKFVRLFATNNELDFSQFNDNEKNEIDESVKTLVENARIFETRKLQQQYFMNVLELTASEDFVNKFKNNEEFRMKYMQLLIVFNHKSNMHDKDAKHHIFIEEKLLSSAKKI